MTQRKKKRKKRRYKTGEHNSIKLLNGPAHFRSGWEKCYMNWLDDNDDIKSYSYESVIIGYLGNKSTGKMRHYYPDLLLEYVDGHKQLVEIKPSSKVEQKTNQKKFIAAKIWCKDHDCEFILMTEIEMKKLGINLLIQGDIFIVMLDVKNVTNNNLQMILRQRFEIIKYGNKNDILPAQQDIDELYEHFVVKNNVMSSREFRYNLVCAEVAARRQYNLCMSIIMGLDISTSVTGITFLDRTNDFDPKKHILYQEAIVFKQTLDFWGKVDYYRTQITRLYNRFGGIETFGVESPLKRFASGASSASTVCLLQRFNGIVSYITRDIYRVDPVFIGVTDARKSCGIKTQQTKKAGMNAKMQTARWMLDHDLQHINYPLKRGCEEDIVRTIYNVKSFVFDEIDSYVVARGVMNQL